MQHCGVVVERRGPGARLPGLNPGSADNELYGLGQVIQLLHTLWGYYKSLSEVIFAGHLE